jgi:3-oxoadipate enol-lactonase
VLERCGRISVAGGELSFEVAGDGEPVVFLHGFGLDSRMWEAQFQALREGFRLIRYDLRGFGRSSLPTVQYGHEDDLYALLTHIAAVPAHVVGLSMGGRIALRFAAAYPGSIRSLVLADSALDGQLWTEDWQTRWTGICDAAKSGGVAEAKRLWLEHPLLATARADRSTLSMLAQMVDDYSGWHWHNSDTARVPAPSLATRLHEIRVPTLVVTGEDDLQDFQTVAATLARNLPGARRCVIEKAGHMVNLEAPEKFNAAIVKFWRSVP